ncbi:putative RNA-directed DNA polymerase from transposon BS [Trichonephila clavipes]|nr:putative RNA-directed DNA polymerase from transposon BS [Trichonephila clavipes]
MAVSSRCSENLSDDFCYIYAPPAGVPALTGQVDRKSKSGGGLAFFVRDINYQKIEYPTDWSDLEVQDSRTTNSKLWRIVKKINKEQEQCEESNSVIETNGQVFPDDKAAANGLAVYYQETSKLVFTSEDKSVMKRAKNIIHGCRTSDVGDQGLSRDFSQQELLLAMAFLDMTKSPGPDGVFGRMLENLGHRGKLRLLDIINLSWKIGRLPAEWKRAIIIPIKKAEFSTFLDSKNLIPGEQYGYRRGHSTVDQIISFCQSIRDAQNCKPTHHTMAALLDLTKAFDRVWKHKLLIKLHDTFNIRDYALEFKLCFNPTKSIATFFTTNKRLYSYQPTLKMDNKNLAYKKHPKYLGYVLDPECGQRLGSRCCNIERHLLALIRPILEYGFPVYCCASAASLEKLEKIQLGAARIITGLRRSCPKEIVLFEADLQPLHLRSKISSPITSINFLAMDITTKPLYTLTIGTIIRD